jgi:cytosine/adenosine deaminase-related metal-dependent hydrolase
LNDANEDGFMLDLSGYLLLPGLINGHDHLELNLFPRLGSGFYPNAKAWAQDVYRPQCSPLREHLGVSKRARLIWGGLKNLACGVTTVAHHNAFDDPCLDGHFPVKIVKRFGWAHSLDFSPDLVKRFEATPREWPFILHAAEGVDERARSEIRRLDALEILNDRAVLVHAIGLDQPDLALLHARRSAIVWCPSSNLSVYGRTLDGKTLRSGLPIALGTDSAITAQGDLLDEIHTARRATDLPLGRLYEMVTAGAARVLRLTEGEGSLQEGGVADIVAVRDTGQRPAEALAALRPEMVMSSGKIRLISAGLVSRVRAVAPRSLQPLGIENRGRWFTDIDVASLHEETASVLGASYLLAGKRVVTC